MPRLDRDTIALIDQAAEARDSVIQPLADRMAELAIKCHQLESHETARRFAMRRCSESVRGEGPPWTTEMAYDELTYLTYRLRTMLAKMGRSDLCTINHQDWHVVQS